MSYSFTNKYHSQSSSGGGGIEEKISEGTTVLRIFTFNHTVTEGDFSLGRYLRSEVKAGQVVEDLFLMTRSHFNPYHECGLMKTCDGRWIGKCETCDRVQEMRCGGDESKDAARKIQANTKFVICAADVTEDKSSYEVKLYKVAKSVMDALMTALESKRLKGKVLFGEKGRDFEVQFDKNRSPATMYQCNFFDADDSVDLTGMVSNTAPDPLSMPHFLSEQFACYFGDAPAASTEGEKPATTRRGRAKKEPEAEPFPAGSTWRIVLPDDNPIDCKVLASKDGVIKVEDTNGDVWNVEAEDLTPLSGE